MPITTYPLDYLVQSTDPAYFAARRGLADVSVRIAKSKRVVVVSGAGISCSSGIPVSVDP
jgi:NAD-dependent histone deacetylase SIR2